MRRERAHHVIGGAARYASADRHGVDRGDSHRQSGHGRFARGGMEEWPGMPVAVTRSEPEPFSVTPISAAGPPVSGCSETAAKPSSKANHARTPRSASKAAITEAPFSPPNSSSCPNAKMMVRVGRRPARASISAASMRPTIELLSSIAPRPHTTPSRKTPPNGSGLPLLDGVASARAQRPGARATGAAAARDRCPPTYT